MVASAEKAHGDLVPAHFQGEHDCSQVVLDGGGTGEVQRERGLTHGGTCCNNDHLAGVESVRQFIQLVEAGRDAGHAFAAVAGGFDLVHGGFHDVLQRHVVLGGTLFRHRVDLGLGLVDQVLHFAVLTVTHLDDFGAAD